MKEWDVDILQVKLVHVSLNESVQSHLHFSRHDRINSALFTPTLDGTYGLSKKKKKKEKKEKKKNKTLEMIEQ